MPSPAPPESKFGYNLPSSSRHSHLDLHFASVLAFVVLTCDADVDLGGTILVIALNASNRSSLLAQT